MSRPNPKHDSTARRKRPEPPDGQPKHFYFMVIAILLGLAIAALLVPVSPAEALGGVR